MPEWTLEQIEQRCRTAENGEPCAYAITDDAADRVTACELCRTCKASGARPSGRAYQLTAMSPYARCPHPDGDRWIGVKPVIERPKPSPSVTRPRVVTGAADRMAICMHCEHHRRDGVRWYCQHSGTAVMVTLGMPVRDGVQVVDASQAGNCPAGRH